MDDIRMVLVHLDGPQRAAERLQLARRVALERGAHVRAMYAAASPVAALPLENDPGGYFAEALLRADEERLAGAIAAYEAVLGRPGGVPSDFLQLTAADPPGTFERQAMYADLLVLGQDDPDRPRAAGAEPGFAERALAGSGRAGIVVPYTGDAGRGFATVVIAWKEAPQAARAVSASLPLLRRAAQVHVLAWGVPPARDDRSLDLRGYLRRHGIEAQWHDGGPESPSEVGDLVLSRAADLSADLLVMGCYGHARAREWILGGASRTVLGSMTLPVLMAH